MRPSAVKDRDASHSVAAAVVTCSNSRAVHEGNNATSKPDDAVRTWRLKNRSQLPVMVPWQYQYMTSCTIPLVRKHAIKPSARNCLVFKQASVHTVCTDECRRCVLNCCTWSDDTAQTAAKTCLLRRTCRQIARPLCHQSPCDTATQHASAL